MVASLTKTNCDALGIDFCGVGFEEDFQILLNLFANQLYAFDAENSFLQTGLNYALTMFIMCLIEKIIKLLVYKFDRFSRNKYETTKHKKTLKDNGVKAVARSRKSGKKYSKNMCLTTYTSKCNAPKY